MPLVIKESETHFEPAPPGLHSAVCVDVVDLGIVDGKFGPKRKLKIIWQTKAKNKMGERFQIRASYTQSLSEGSNLRRDLESWRGRSFTPEERKAFDVERLIGVNCQINVKHNVSKEGRTYANATAIIPAVKGEKLLPENYQREPWPSEDIGAAQAPRDERVYEVDPIDEGAAAQYDDDSTPFVAFLAPLVSLLGMLA